MKRKRRKLYAQGQQERCRGGDGRVERVAVGGVSRVSGVSRALWPAELRQSAAVGKNAQRRRIVRRLWWSFRVRLAQVRLPSVWFAVALLAGSFFLFMLVLRQRHAFVIAMMLMAVAVMHMVSSSLWQLVRPLCRRMWQRSGASFGPGRARRYARKPSIKTVAMLRTPRLAPSLHTPETPMPDNPLIRVLETIDLSSCDVEHFLDTSPVLPSMPTLPNSETGESFMDEYMM